MKTPIKLAALAVGAALVMTGCSSDDSDEMTTTPVETTTTTPEVLPTEDTTDEDTETPDTEMDPAMAAEEVATTYEDFLTAIVDIEQADAQAILDSVSEDPTAVPEDELIESIRALAPQAYEMVDFGDIGSFDQGYFYGMTLGLAAYMSDDSDVVFTVDPSMITVDGDTADLPAGALTIEVDGETMSSMPETGESASITFVHDGDDWKILAESVTTL